jgi:hypothetical protein
MTHNETPNAIAKMIHEEMPNDAQLTYNATH